MSPLPATGESAEKTGSTQQGHPHPGRGPHRPSDDRAPRRRRDRRMDAVACRGRPSRRSETLAALPAYRHSVGVVTGMARPAAAGGRPRPHHLRLLRHTQGRAATGDPDPVGPDRLGCAGGADHRDGHRPRRPTPPPPYATASPIWNENSPNCAPHQRSSSGSRSPSSTKRSWTGSSSGSPTFDTSPTPWAPPLPRSASSSPPHALLRPPLHRPGQRQPHPIPRGEHDHSPTPPHRSATAQRRWPLSRSSPTTTTPKLFRR